MCRARVHKWGRANRVSFDLNKEHIVIVHPIHANGDPFKFLGCMVDCKLRMDQAIDRILIQIRPKIQAILRTRKYYPVNVLINQFETHVWSLMEIHNGAIFHASTTLLEKLDSVQRSFLHELEITEECAFIDHNFAPPTLRRNIGILGLLQKRVLGKTLVIYQRLLAFVHDIFGFLREGEHNKQLYNHCLEIHYQQELWKRSIFCMTDVYNRLPQHVVDIPNVSNFQTALTHIARTACQNGNAEWQSTFSSR